MFKPTPTPSVSPTDLLNNTAAGGIIKTAFILVAVVLFAFGIARTLMRGHQ